jgi:FkbM family methyltransferase
MNFASSIKAFARYATDFRRLPFHPYWPQLPAYLLSYFQGRAAARANGEAGNSIRPRRFTFRLNQKIIVSLRPEHFGMARGILVDKEYSDLPLGFEPKRVLDLGANIGLGLLVLHDQYPQAELAGVDADPRNFPLLLQNLADNNMALPLLAAAISGETGILSLRIGENSTCSTLIEGDLIHPSHTGTLDVPCLTMSQVLERLNWPSVDLLKVDIEGAEESLFSHENQWLHNVKAIVMEIHPNTTPEKIQDLLAPFGFRLRRQSFGTEPVFFADRSAF